MISVMSGCGDAAARAIDRRRQPAVGGIDLVEALNYIGLADVGEAFIYDRYTSSRLFYTPGNLRNLEVIAAERTKSCRTSLEEVEALARFVSEEITWAGFYRKRTGQRLPMDRGLTEEEIIKSGCGWCNEQARVLCFLTQIRNMPSRLVFASDKSKQYGHTLTEVLMPSGWMMVDQSFAYCFAIEGRPVRAADVYRDKANRKYFAPIYKQMCQDLLDQLGTEILLEDFEMALADNPLDGFEILGFHNHFLV